MECLDSAPGGSVYVGASGFSSHSTRLHTVIRLLLPLSSDKGESAAKSLARNWVTCHNSCGTEVELCLLHTLPYLNLQLDLMPCLSWRVGRRLLRASLMASGWRPGPRLHPVT